MIRHALAAAVLLAATPAAAQSTTQDALDERYDRALAAGYKALFLCSAIANAERNGAARTPASVEAWELTGIQAPLDKIAPELSYEVHRRPASRATAAGSKEVSHVSVAWSDSMPPRIAIHDSRMGCQLAPIGGGLPPFVTTRPGQSHPVAAVTPFAKDALQTVGEGAFAQLQHLALGDNGIGAEGASSLAAAGRFASRKPPFHAFDSRPFGRFEGGAPALRRAFSMDASSRSVSSTATPAA